MGEYMFLSDPAAVTGEYNDGNLTLWTTDSFIKGMLDKPTVRPAVAAEASRLTGQSVQVFVKEGSPATVSTVEEHDNLDDLLALGQQFDNIDIKF